MSFNNLEEFKSQALSTGFDEVIERVWSANVVVPEHTHPFTAYALVTEGEMWMTRGQDIAHLKVGDTFLMDPGTPHSEKYGPNGAIYWVARKN
ncbi:MAG: cupin domain-containing protein [Betaproteobacteria bacterium]|jgi:mannose-6-phosphate isomerase-like protein (cupin superfamily)